MTEKEFEDYYRKLKEKYTEKEILESCILSIGTSGEDYDNSKCCININQDYDRIIKKIKNYDNNVV